MHRVQGPAPGVGLSARSRAGRVRDGRRSGEPAPRPQESRCDRTGSLDRRAPPRASPRLAGGSRPPPAGLAAAGNPMCPDRILGGGPRPGAPGLAAAGIRRDRTGESSLAPRSFARPAGCPMSSASCRLDPPHLRRNCPDLPNLGLVGRRTPPSVRLHRIAVRPGAAPTLGRHAAGPRAPPGSLDGEAALSPALAARRRRALSRRPADPG